MKEITVDIPDEDCDVVLRFPSRQVVIVQARPSNADVKSNGSLDFILPGDQVVTNWKGDDMQAASVVNPLRQHIRLTKQMVCELP